MSDNDAGLSIIYKGGYVSDLAICIDPTDRFYGWLLARNPLDGRWVSLTKLDFNTATLHEALYTLRARIAELEAELERERVRVAACGVVAMANTRDSAREARQVLPEYRSALLCDVERAVDREMAERERRESAEAALRELVSVDDERDRIIMGRLYGKPHLPEHKALELDHRQRRLEAWRAARNHFARYEKEPT